MDTGEDVLNFEGIKKSISEAALYEQLAEECAELSQAALKKARILRGENPTPIDMDSADEKVAEEYSDVSLCARVIGLEIDIISFNYKYMRWVERIMKKEDGGN